MNNNFIYLFLLPAILFLVGCNRISNDPIVAGHQYIERMTKAAKESDYAKGEEITTIFLDKFENENAFFAAVITELQDENAKDVTQFMTSYDLSSHEPIRQMMIHCIALQKACEDHLGMTPAELYLRNK